MADGVIFRASVARSLQQWWLHTHNTSRDEIFRSDSLTVSTTQLVEAYFSTEEGFFACLCSSFSFIPQFFCVSPFRSTITLE